MVVNDPWALRNPNGKRNLEPQITMSQGQWMLSRGHYCLPLLLITLHEGRNTKSKPLWSIISYSVFDTTSSSTNRLGLGECNSTDFDLLLRDLRVDPDLIEAPLSFQKTPKDCIKLTLELCSALVPTASFITVAKFRQCFRSGLNLRLPMRKNAQKCSNANWHRKPETGHSGTHKKNK